MKIKTSSILLISTLLCCSCSSSNNVKKYDEFLIACKNEVDFHSQLYIFPDSTSIGTPKAFSYKHTDDLFTGSFLLYLSMEYEEDKFNEELSRLANIEAHFSENKIKKIIHFEEECVFLTINKDDRYEYAKYNKQTYEIGYVSNQLYSWTIANIDLRNKLPNLTIPSELDDGDNAYNMYYYYSEFPEGVIVGEYVSD